MANNRQDIDQFLFEKLNSLEGIQDDSVWLKISQYLEHHKAPIDLLLSKQLYNLEQHPPVSIEKKILNNPSINSPIIDQRLHALLSVLESEPEKEFKFEKKDKKRRRLLPFLLIPILITSSIVYIFNTTESEQKNIEPNTIETTQSLVLESITPHELNNLEDKKDIQLNNKIEYSEIKELSTIKVREAFKIVHSDTKSIEPQLDEILETENIQKELKLKNIEPFDWQEEQSIDKIKTEFITRKPMIRTLPFKIGIWSSYYQENRNKSELVNGELHKDYEKIINESNAKTQSGRATQISFEYKINRRLSINANIEHGSAEGTSTIHYIYTDIPVYDSTGKISGYINRPLSQSPVINQTIKSKSSSTNLPIQINFTIIQTKKWTLIAGLGSNFQISKHTNFSIFDFKKGRIEEVEERFKYQISSMANMQVRYTINNKLSLGLNYRINPQSLQFHPQGNEFKGIVMRNTLQFGLIYTPIIKR